MDQTYGAKANQQTRRKTWMTLYISSLKMNRNYWVDAKVSADFLKNVFKRCSATMDAWFSCI